MLPLTKYILLHDQPATLTVYAFATKRDILAYVDRSLSQDDVTGAPIMRELIQYLGVPMDWQDIVTLKVLPQSEGVWG